MAPQVAKNAPTAATAFISKTKPPTAGKSSFQNDQVDNVGSGSGAGGRLRSR